MSFFGLLNSNLGDLYFRSHPNGGGHREGGGEGPFSFLANIIDIGYQNVGFMGC